MSYYEPAHDADEYDDDAVDHVRLHRSLHRSRRRRTWVLVTLLVFVPIAVILGFGAWVWWQLDPPGKPGAAVQIEVTKGWGVPQIGDELASRDVIGSSFVFQAYARLRGSGPFQPGRYEMRRNLGVKRAISVLDKGPQIDIVNLAIIPGQRLTEIAATVEKKVPWLDGGAFLELARAGTVRSPYEPAGTKTLEGLLSPDTYRVDENETERELLTTMERQFDAEAAGAGLTPSTRVQGYGAYDIIKIASLIQSEAKVDGDRPLIASVIYNRLKLGMPLQIDATVLYANKKRSGITTADLNRPSPYNTYTTHGLPPTPISGVTPESLRAALHPASTNYLYYVIAGRDGHHAFSSTYAGQQENIAKARAAGLL